MTLPAALEFVLAQLAADPLAAALWRAGRRPRVGISSCLLGEAVRYDGDSRRCALLADLLPRLLELRPLCPEVGIGMGVPRPPIQRVRLPGGREVIRGVENPALDVTAALDTWAAGVLAGPALHGYVCKARSPSCAPGNAPLFDPDDRPLGLAWGRHAEAVRGAFPGIPMADEEALASPEALAVFVLACYLRAAKAPE